MRKQIQLVSTHNSCPKRRWRKTSSNWLLSSQQSDKEVHLAHAKSGRYFLSAKWCKYLSTLDLQAGYHHISLDKASSQDCLYLTIWEVQIYESTHWTHTCSRHTFRNLWQEYWKISTVPLLIWMNIIIFSKMAKEHLDHIKTFFEKLRSAHLSMNSVNVTFSWRKSSI